MSKLKIAIDVDDVLVESAGEIIGNYNKRWGTHLEPTDFYGIHNADVWGVTDEETAIQRVEQYILSPQFAALVPTQDAIRALNKLSQVYELYVLTGRPDTIAVSTRDWLQQYFPGIFISANFSNLFDKEKMRSKGEMCVELGVKILIDDHIKHVRSAVEYGLEAVLFGEYPWNNASELPKGVIRCKDWAAVLEYFDGRS